MDAVALWQYPLLIRAGLHTSFCRSNSLRTPADDFPTVGPPAFRRAACGRGDADGRTSAVIGAELNFASRHQLREMMPSQFPRRRACPSQSHQPSPAPSRHARSAPGSKAFGDHRKRTSWARRSNQRHPRPLARSDHHRRAQCRHRCLGREAAHLSQRGRSWVEHVQTFPDCCRSRIMPNSDVAAGHRAQQAAHLTKQSYLEHRRIHFDPDCELALPSRSESGFGGRKSSTIVIPFRHPAHPAHPFC